MNSTLLASCFSSKDPKVAVSLSVFLGYSGAAEFYLGYIVEPLFKLLFLLGSLSLAYWINRTFSEREKAQFLGLKENAESLPEIQPQRIRRASRFLTITISVIIFWWILDFALLLSKKRKDANGCILW